jgi:hypothetical protein
MTSLVAWIAVDSRGPASFYIASDSRITWGKAATWNYGKKVFASASSPDLFGYTGDVLFPFIFLSQISDYIRVSKWTSFNVEEKHEQFLRFLESALESYPETRRNAFSLLHCSREHSGMNSRFHLWETRWAPPNAWFDYKHHLPEESSLIAALGSGKETVVELDQKWRASDAGGTSRAVFSAFCEAISSNQDWRSGGPPQLVGLYRRGSGEQFGIIHEGGRHLSGLLVTLEIASVLRVEWRNNLFERCDAMSMKLKSGAKRHARPKV